MEGIVIRDHRQSWMRSIITRGIPRPGQRKSLRLDVFSSHPSWDAMYNTTTMAILLLHACTEPLWIRNQFAQCFLFFSFSVTRRRVGHRPWSSRENALSLHRWTGSSWFSYYSDVSENRWMNKKKNGDTKLATFSLSSFNWWISDTAAASISGRRRRRPKGNAKEISSAQLFLRRGLYVDLYKIVHQCLV